MLAELWQDVRSATRSWRRDFRSYVVIVLCLAAGVACATSVYTVGMALAFRPLPALHDPARLVVIREERTDSRGSYEWMSYPAFRDVRDNVQSLGDAAAFAWSEANVSSDGGADRIAVSRVSGGFFRTIGVQPLQGRLLSEADVAQSQPVLVISHGLWLGRFGARTDVIGRTLRLDGVAHTVVGVAGPELVFPPGARAWAPFDEQAAWARDRAARRVRVVARLAEPATLSLVNQALSREAARIALRHPRESQFWTITADAAERFYGSRPRSLVFVMLFAVGFLLAATCANAASMLLAFGVTRRDEIAVRLALGAGLGRIARQFAVDALLVAGIAAILGALLTHWGVSALIAVIPGELHPFLPGLASVHVDGRALAFATAVSVGSALLFGIAPAVQAMRTNINGVLTSAARDASGGMFGKRLRELMLGVQVATALVLLSATTRLAGVFTDAASDSLGFSADGVHTARISLPARLGGERSAQFFDAVLAKVGDTGQLAAVASILPFAWADRQAQFSRAGAPEHTAPMTMRLRFVSADYPRVLRIPLVAGRAFESGDVDGRIRVALVSIAAARRLWSSERDAVGRRLHVLPDSIELEIVGVLADVRQNAMLNDAGPATVYLPSAQWPSAAMTLVWRGDPLSGPSLSRLVTQLDPDAVVTEVRALSDVVSSATAPQRGTAIVLASLALIALALVAFGIYGAVRYTTLQLSREVGIRRALGAGPWQVVRGVTGRTGKVLAIALTAGVVGSVALNRALEAYVDGMAGGSAGAIMVPVLTLAIIAAMACLTPVRAVFRVDLTRVLAGQR